MSLLTTHEAAPGAEARLPAGSLVMTGLALRRYPGYPRVGGRDDPPGDRKDASYASLDGNRIRSGHELQERIVAGPRQAGVQVGHLGSRLRELRGGFIGYGRDVVQLRVKSLNLVVQLPELSTCIERLEPTVNELSDYGGASVFCSHLGIDAVELFHRQTDGDRILSHS